MSLPDSITAVLLLQRPAIAEPSALRVHLNDVLGPGGVYFDQFPSRHGTTLAAEGLTIELRERDLPLPSTRMERALASRLPQILHEDWAGVVGRHRAAIVLDLHRRPQTPPRRPDAGDGPAAAAPRTPREAVDLMLMAGHLAASWISHGSRPLAVYWSQSERIFPATRFRAMEGMLFPLPLFLHPRPVGDIPEDRQALPEFEMLGAPELIGCNLRVAPARARFDWMMKRVLAYVAHVRANDALLTEGSAFAMEDGERFSVRRTADGGVGLVLDARNGQPVEGAGRDHFAAVV